LVAESGLHGPIEIVTLCGFHALMGRVNGCFDVHLPHPSAQ
jgi:hypothetical protein